MQVRAPFSPAAVMIPHFRPAEPEVDGLICLGACQVGLGRGGQRVDWFIDLLFDSNNNNNKEEEGAD